MATRRERVVLDLEDNFTAGIARAAVATQVLDKSLNSLDGTSGRAQRSMSPLGDPGGPIGKTGNQSQRAGAEIDKLSGRLRLLTDVALILGPAIAPLGAAAVGGVVALSAQFGALAGGLGVTILALNGVGDGLKALNAYQLEPTAANLEKLNQQMEALGPSGEHFVRFLDDLGPQLQTLQFAARDGLLPGLEDGIDSLMQRLPEVRGLITDFATELGGLASGAGGVLGGDRFDAFFEYLRTDGVPILDDTARTMGLLAEAAANTMAAFGPLQLDFSGGLLDWAQGLADASADLDSNPGFQEFLTYIEDTGPQVLATLGALANAVLQIVEATAPLGGPVLKALEGVANAIAMIADSDLGTPIFVALGALALYNRSVAATAALNSTAWGGKALGNLKGYTSGLLTVTSAQERAQMSAAEMDAANKSSAGSMLTAKLGALGLVASLTGVADKAGLSNTALLAMAGPWGAAAGFALDMWHSTDGLKDSLSGLDAAINGGSIPELSAQIEQARAELKGIEDDRQGVSFGEALLGPLGGLTDMESGFGAITGKTGDLQSKLSEAVAKMAELKKQGPSTGSGIDVLSGSLKSVTESADAAATAIADSVQAMRDQRTEALRALDAQLNYQAAIDDARKALKENGKTADITTEKGRANRTALYALADAWNGQSDAVKSAKGNLKAAKANFEDVATSMGISADKAHDLAGRLFEIKPRSVTVKVETAGASAAVDAILGRMRQLKDRTVHVNVVTNNVRPQGGQTQTEDQVTTTPRRAPRHNPRVAGRSATGLSPLSPLDVYTTGRSAASAKADMYRQKADQDVASTSEDAATAVHHLAGAAWHASDGIKKWNDRVIEAQQKALDAAKQRRDDALAQRDSISSSIQQGLGGDIWAASSGSVWGSGASAANSPAGALAQLQAQKARAQRLIAAINTLKSKGITGPVLLEIIGSGDVERAEAMASLDVGTLGSFASVYTDTQSTLAAAGLAGGNAVVGESNIARLEKAALDELKELREIKQAIKDGDKHNQQGHKDNANFVTAGVNGAASNGHKRGKR